MNQRLAAAEFDENSFCAVAGISLRPQRAAARAECCVGDAITMIPPVTGNGMSMAFESAELAVEPLAAWSRGEISWARPGSKCWPMLRRRICAAAGVGQMVAADDAHAVAAKRPRPVRRAQRMVLADGL